MFQSVFLGCLILLAPTIAYAVDPYASASTNATYINDDPGFRYYVGDQMKAKFTAMGCNTLSPTSSHPNAYLHKTWVWRDWAWETLSVGSLPGTLIPAGGSSTRLITCWKTAVPDNTELYCELETSMAWTGEGITETSEHSVAQADFTLE